MRNHAKERGWPVWPARLSLIFLLAMAAMMLPPATGWRAGHARAASVFTVNSSNDVDDSACNGAHCSLREAINAANASLGTDTIQFAIASGAVTISPTSALPLIGDPVTIDGTTQPGFFGTPLVRLDGGSAGPGVSGLIISAGSSTVRGLMITGFKASCSPSPTGCGGMGIELTTNSGSTIAGNYIGTDGVADLGNDLDGVIALSGAHGTSIGGLTPADRNVISGNDRHGIRIASTNSNTIQGNYIGTNAAGSSAIGNVGNGIELAGQFNLIGGTVPGARNVVSGNGDCTVCARAGISVSDTSSSFNSVQGNYVGVDATGMNPLGNTNAGIRFDTFGASSGNVIGGTAGVTPGGSCTGACNLVSSNGLYGVWLAGARSLTIAGNFIGTDVSGTLARPNADNGIAVIGIYNIIGGTVPAARNLISGNGTLNPGNGNNSDGIWIGGGSSSNVVQGNYIGTKTDGLSALPNLNDGVSIRGSVLTTIGGNAAAQRNIISGNGLHGVEVWGAGAGDANDIIGNFIGTDATGSAGLPNATDGVRIQVASAHVRVGQTAPGTGNVIAFNAVDGVHVDGIAAVSHYNPIRGNNIFSNGNLGIELTNGGNDSLAAPVITGAVMGTACALCEIDVFSTDSAQGRRYEGSTTADGGGNWAYSGSLMGPGVTATATDAAGNGSSTPCTGLANPHECGNTSPFASTLIVDADSDGCFDTKELGPNHVLGGQRNPNSHWDFFDVPVPALLPTNTTGTRNKAISINDVISIVAYIGTSSASPNTPNSNGAKYGTDLNNNGYPDGQEYDRTPGTPAWAPSAPSGAVAIADALIALSSIGDNCN